MAKVWLVTGSGNGLGRDIVEAALAAGDSVVAGARRIAELAPLVEQYGERIKQSRSKFVTKRRQKPRCRRRLTLSAGSMCWSIMPAMATSLLLSR